MDLNTGASKNAQQLERIVRATPWFMQALQAGRALGLPTWCVGAGALRNAVWDHLHGHAHPSALADVDFTYFDASQLSRERDLALQAQLQRLAPSLPWEVTNQAGVHLWFEAEFGHAVAPLCTLEEAVASWPETCTAVAVQLHADGSLSVMAPHGLEDLLEQRVRHNPVRASLATYRQRVASKRYQERWPGVVVVPG